MPEAFQFPSPDTASGSRRNCRRAARAACSCRRSRRLKPGASVAGVTEEGRSRVVEGDPRFKATLIVQTLRDQMVGGVHRLLWVLRGRSGVRLRHCHGQSCTAAAHARRRTRTRVCDSGGARRRPATADAAAHDRKPHAGRDRRRCGAVRWPGRRCGCSSRRRQRRYRGCRMSRSTAQVLLFASLLTIGSALVVGVLSAGRALGFGVRALVWIGERQPDVTDVASQAPVECAGRRGDRAHDGAARRRGVAAAIVCRTRHDRPGIRCRRHTGAAGESPRVAISHSGSAPRIR